MKKSLVLLLVLIMCTAASIAYAAPDLPPQANTDKERTNFVALGDSIAVGLSAMNDDSYVNLYFDELNIIDGHMKLRNKAIEGQTSGDLLNAMRHDQHINTKIRKAKVITISIGANDLLGPFVEHIYAFLAVEYDLDITADDFEQQLAMAIAYDPDWTTVTLPSLLVSMPDLSGAILEFESNLNDIMLLIRGSIDQKGLNPDADIYFLNLYNPLPVEWIGHLLFGTAYNGFDGLILAMNTVIGGYSLLYDYEVIDVYAAFRPEENAVLFLDESIGTNPHYLDPHPSTPGHVIIYELHP